LEPGREPSSSAQNSPEPKALVYILLSAFAFLSGWLFSKSRTPNENGSKTIPPQDTPTPESRQREMRPSVVSQIPPTPSQQGQSNGRKDSAPAWEKSAAIIIAAGTIGLLVVNWFQGCQTKKAADAATSAAGTANATLKATQRQFRDEQRPYIWLEIGVALPNLPISNTPLSELVKKRVMLGFNVGAKNGGHSPAVEIIITKVVRIFDTSEKAKRQAEAYVPEYLPTDDVAPKYRVLSRKPTTHRNEQSVDRRYSI
jgi:hypothetical protein